MPGQKTDRVSVARFIKQVRDVDRIRIEISGGQNALVDAYSYKRAPEKGNSVEWWVTTRRIRDHLPPGAQLRILDRSDSPAGSETSLKFVVRDE